MRNAAITVVTGLWALAACAPTDTQTAGALGGAAIGFITAEALELDAEWTVATVLAGAAAGSLVARNETTRTCAYARGDGTYYTRAC